MVNRVCQILLSGKPKQHKFRSGRQLSSQKTTQLFTGSSLQALGWPLFHFRPSPLTALSLLGCLLRAIDRSRSLASVYNFSKISTSVFFSHSLGILVDQTYVSTLLLTLFEVRFHKNKIFNLGWIPWLEHDLLLYNMYRQ